jgi:hypothetical protein
MARATFQGRLRTYSGRTKSAIDKRNGVPKALLAQNLSGPIQVVLKANPANGDYEVGFLPAFWALERIRVISPAGAGTIAITLPAYNGLAAVTLVAALASATSVAADLALANGLLASYAKDRPLVVTTTGVTGLLRVGLFGFPLDDAAASGD